MTINDYNAIILISVKDRKDKHHENKKIISAFVSTAMAFSLVSLVPARVSAASDASGTGWSFTAADGKLSFNSNYTVTELTRGIIDGLDGNAAGGAFQRTDIKILETGDSAITSIGEQAFYNCTNLTTIELPKVTSIGNSAFINCSNLTTINSPKVTSIGESAFKSCTNLTILSLPQVTSVGEFAFNSCTNLTTLSLPQVTSIGGGTFGYCDNLTTINLPQVTSIDNFLFNCCYHLTTVTMPQVTSVGEFAFNSCANLTTVSLPNATSIGPMAFIDCVALKSITFGKLTPPSLGADILLGTDQSKIKINIPYNADITAWKTALDAAGYTTVKIEKLAPPVINITTPQSDFIGGVTGTPYKVALTGSGPGFTYSLDIGDLPDGLTLSTGGLISGTPTAAGTFTFIVKATNGVSTTTQTYTITVSAPSALPEPVNDDWYTSRRRSSLPIGGYTIHDNDEEAEDIAAGAGVVSEEILV